MTDEPLLVRSYRRVFRLERRLYRVDRWTIPVPGGIPLAALAWFLAGLLAVVALGQMPAVGAVLDVLAPPLRYLILPAGIAVLTTQATRDARPFHRLALAWIRYGLRPHRTRGGAAVPVEGERLKLPPAVPLRQRQLSARIRTLILQARPLRARLRVALRLRAPRRAD